MKPKPSDWYACEIDRGEFKAFMRRNNARAFAQFGGFLALVAAAGCLAYLSLGTVWAVPAFLFYGTIFAFAEAATHEFDHGTPFRTRWLNDAGSWIACFMMWREPVFGRYKHARHHSYTSILGIDTEGAGFRPRNLFDQAIEMMVRYRHARLHLGANLRHAVGIVSERDRTFYCIPESEHRRMCWNSRFLLLAYGAVIAWSVAAQSWLPLLFLVLPHSYGAWLFRPLFKGPARRAGDQHHRSPGDHPHHAAGPGPAVPLLEHELPYRAPPLPDGAVPRPAQAP